MNALDRERIERLRVRALDGRVTYDEFYLHFDERFAVNADRGGLYERYADAYAAAMDSCVPETDADELIAGRMRALNADEQERYARIRGIGDGFKMMMGQDSHMAIDYELLLAKGILGIEERIGEYLASAGDAEKISFYNACLACLDAVCRYSDRYADSLEKLAQTDEANAAELRELAGICRRVPKGPAGGFHEAVQSVHFVSYCLSIDPLRPDSMQQFQLGHPDRYLLPYYENDIKTGALTPERAQLLLDCLGIQINRRVPRGLSSGYMVGGRNRNGRPVDNDLTKMGIRVIDDIRLVYPSVGLCYTGDTSDETLTLACETLSHGRSHPAIFNDDVITRGLMRYGVDEENAHEYIHSTCVEITPAAASNVWVASPYMNMPQLLLDSMDREYDTFDELMGEIYRRLDEGIRRNFEEQNGYRRERCERSIHPLLSCFVNDCLARGTDIDRGGARYNWIMPSFVGMANLVDSLEAVNGYVFREGKMTLKELKRVLESDFEGNEALRLKLENDYAKYGNNIDEVDGRFTGIVDHIVKECGRYTPMLTNARLIPSVFCWIMHEQFGRDTIATPDGRRAYFPLGDGSGACQGREKKGPTASVLSCTKWDHTNLIGGVAMNIKFSKKTFTSSSLENVKALIRTYIRRGGFEIQVNVVDRETLLKAQQHPEEYRDLVVRIGGYSDYFVALSPGMQAEVLLRTAHEV